MADISQSNWNETDSANTSTPPDGWPGGMFPNAVEPAARAIMGAVKRFWDRINGTLSSTGSGGAYALAYTVGPSAYVSGETYQWRANFTSVGGDTLNINGIGAKPLYKPSSSGPTAVVAGDIQSGQMVETPYDSTLNSGAGGFMLMGGIAASSIPSGTTVPFAGGSAPTGWFLCYGQAVLRTTYATLFAAIGTTYGSGDGSTTFNLPDLRGRVVAGVDNMGGTAANRITNGNSGISGTTLGASGGDERMESHAHTVNDPQHRHLTVDPAYGSTLYNATSITGATTAGGAGAVAQSGSIYTGLASTGVTINSTGAGGSQNVQPTMMMNYIIKT